MYSPRNSLGNDKENIVPGNLCIIWKPKEAWSLKKDSATFLWLLKLLKLKNNSITALQHLKFFKLQKGLRHFLMTLKVFNIEKGYHHFLETLKGFNFEKLLYHILMTLIVLQNSYSVECWWTVASEGCLLYMFINQLDLLWVPNFIALEIYFLFGTKFSWNEGINICFNVEYLLLGRNCDFLGGYWVVTVRYLMVTARYRLLLLIPTFSTNAMAALSVLSS